MSLQRSVVPLGVVAAAAVLAWAAVDLVRDPYGERRDALDAQIEEIPPGGRDDAAAVDAPYREWQQAVQSKGVLWESLTPPPKAAEAPINFDEQMKSIAVKPGAISRGKPNAKVRITTADSPSGRWYKKGDAVTPSVAVTDITESEVVFKVTAGARSGEYRVPLP